MKASQIASLVRQSFDVFNVYGKDAQAVENIVLGFHLSLEDFDMIDITPAFKDWMRSSGVMPTPHDIRLKTEEQKKFREVRAGKNSAVSSGPARMVPREPNPNLDPWVYKQYPDAISDGSVSAFFQHHGTKPKPEEREVGYEWLRYACDFLQYPRRILAEFRQYAGLEEAA